MLLIRSLLQISSNKMPLENIMAKGTALTIGNFDGVHLGHLKIINKVKEIAKEKNLTSAILTFEPHPSQFFKKAPSQDFRLTNLSQKINIFTQNKIDSTIIFPFNQALANLSAQDFINKILIEKLNVKHLIIGHDFIFGKDREGTPDMLKSYNLQITKIDALKNNSKICSSTLIRNFIKNGEVSQANQVLGRNFIIEGIVVNGKKLARILGFKTANINPKSHIIKPKFGVYKVLAHIPHLNKKLPAIMNFGLKPTIAQSLEPLYEIHILNFDDDIYGKKIKVELLDFLREEKKFATLDDLKKQIIIDINSIK